MQKATRKHYMKTMMCFTTIDIYENCDIKTYVQKETFLFEHHKIYADSEMQIWWIWSVLQDARTGPW